MSRIIAARPGRLPQPCFLKVRGALLKARRQHGIPEILRLGRFIGIGVGPFHFQHPDGGKPQELFNRLPWSLGLRRGNGSRSCVGSHGMPAERKQQRESKEGMKRVHGRRSRKNESKCPELFRCYSDVQGVVGDGKLQFIKPVPQIPDGGVSRFDRAFSPPDDDRPGFLHAEAEAVLPVPRNGNQGAGREKFVPPSDDGPALDDRGHDEQAVLESRQLYIQIRLCRSQRAASLCGIGGDALRRERGVGFRRIAIQQSPPRFYNPPGKFSPVPVPPGKDV